MKHRNWKCTTVNYGCCKQFHTVTIALPQCKHSYQGQPRQQLKRDKSRHGIYLTRSSCVTQIRVSLKLLQGATVYRYAHYKKWKGNFIFFTELLRAAAGDSISERSNTRNQNFQVLASHQPVLSTRGPSFTSKENLLKLRNSSLKMRLLYCSIKVLVLLNNII